MTVPVLTKDEVTRLLNVPSSRTAVGRRDRALLSVMALGGLRIAEAVGLKRDNVHEHDGVTRLTFSGKGDKMRTVTLPQKAADALRRSLADHSHPHCFLSADHGWPLSVRGGRYVADKCFSAAGLADWVHPHTLRHSCATMLLRATNGDIRTVQRTLGHASPETTAKFYDGWNSTDSDRAAAALERFM